MQVVLTDYPDACLLENLEFNIAKNTPPVTTDHASVLVSFSSDFSSHSLCHDFNCVGYLLKLILRVTYGAVRWNPSWPPYHHPRPRHPRGALI
jgi:hypothetical protein